MSESLLILFNLKVFVITSDDLRFLSTFVIEKVVKRQQNFYYSNNCPNFRTNELKVWTVLSTDDIYNSIY